MTRVTPELRATSVGRLPSSWLGTDRGPLPWDERATKELVDRTVRSCQNCWRRVMLRTAQQPDAD
ncbi:hypothetical protein Hte_000350, partial [Hypoxylon texense]